MVIHVQSYFEPSGLHYPANPPFENSLANSFRQLPKNTIISKSLSLDDASCNSTKTLFLSLGPFA